MLTSLNHSTNFAATKRFNPSPTVAGKKVLFKGVNNDEVVQKVNRDAPASF
jgi:hypothetical protein